MVLQIADDSDQMKWDEIVTNSSLGTIFHSWKWLKIVETATRSKLIPIMGYSGSAPIGIFPLFVQRKGFITIVSSPPPKSALLFLGPVFVGWDSISQSKRESNYLEFQKEVDEYIKKEIKADYVSISFPPKLMDIRPYLWADYKIDVLYDYVTPLNSSLEDIWLKLMKKMRANISKSKKMGFTVELGGKPELETIYHLMVQRYKDQDKKETIPKNYLSDLYDEFPENFKIFTVKYQGEIITGQIDLQYKNQLISWVGSPKPNKPISPSPNDLCEWEALVFAHSHGMEEFIVYGAARNERLHKFYVKMNPELHTRFSAKKMSFVAHTMEKAYLKIIKPIQFIS